MTRAMMTEQRFFISVARPRTGSLIARHRAHDNHRQIAEWRPQHAGQGKLEKTIMGVPPPVRLTVEP